MTERERLVELIETPNKASCVRKEKDICDFKTSEILADFLLQNGVIVPPCKVGNTIYRIGRGDYEGEIFEWDIERIEQYADQTIIYDDSDNVILPCQIHKTVFLTREEAEKALEERQNK